MINIQRGRVTRPQRVVIYAPEGLGKSTLASQLANPLFLDFEKGTHHLDVARVEPATLTDVDQLLSDLAKDSQGFETLVIDTIDWLEELVVEDICRVHKKQGIEDFGYGKGYTILAERFSQLLSSFDRVADKMHVVCLAHSHVKRLELPETAPFDHYELKLSKQVAPLVREWCDALLFGNWKTVVKELDNDKTKLAKGSGKERKFYCAHSGMADAKNRHSLADEEPWSLETMAKVLGVKPASAPIDKPNWMKAQESKASAPVAEEKPQPEKPEPVSDGIPGLAPENGGATPLPAVLVATCEPNEGPVNAFLLARNQIKQGQTWRDLRGDYIARIVANPARFLEFCKPKEAVA